MIKLLNANFERLRKNKVFWLFIIFSITLALAVIYASYSDMKKYGVTIEVDQLMLNYATMIGIAIAIFTSLFLGVEYSDGAIRNKISIGHKRTNIYLSNFIIVTITSILSYILWIIVIALIGIPLFGGIVMEMKSLLILIGCIFVAIIAFSAIFTFITMISSNKTITSIVNIMSGFGLMMIALICLNILQTPKYITQAKITAQETNGYKMEKTPNPKYPSESKKKICHLLLDINPAGQMYQLAERNTQNPIILSLYSLGVIVIFTTAGIIIFKKKELK